MGFVPWRARGLHVFGDLLELVRKLLILKVHNVLYDTPIVAEGQRVSRSIRQGLADASTIASTRQLARKVLRQIICKVTVKGAAAMY